jgi:DNA-binding protein YbaB
MTDPLSNVERMIDEWERNANEKAERYNAMTSQVEQISITESAANGAVSVTVGSNGIPSNVTMTEGVSRMRPDEIAAAVMQAMTLAQSRYPAELARIMGETVGDDAATRHMLEVAERNFPSPDDVPPLRPRRDEGDDGEYGEENILR